MAPSRTQSYIHGPRPSPLSRMGHFLSNPGAQSPLNVYSVAGEPRYIPASNLPPGPIAPGSRLMFQGGTQHFSVQQHFHESADMNDAEEVVAHQAPILQGQQGLFDWGSQLLINGGQTTFHQETHTHYHGHNHHNDVLTALYQISATAAVYNSQERFDAPKCHPNTRARLRHTIRNWAISRNRATSVVEPDTDPQLMWLYGSAGTGKSAIAQTTSEDLSLICNLAASFFFSRTASESSYRGDEKRFVTTIAYQLTEVMPGLRSYVKNTMDNRPSVFTLTLCEQVMALIMDPLRALIRDHGDMDLVFILPKIIVVDGLDECKDEAGQKQVLEAIATLVSRPDIFPFSVFLASRPELAIRTWIASKQSAHPNLIRSVSLLDHCDSDHDIEVFVKAGVAEIREVHPLRFKIPADWPSREPIKEVVKRASGQFVYASTVMKYVKDPRNDPRQRLESILQNTMTGSDRPYAELDGLYLHILRQTQHPILVHQILAFRLVTNSFWGSFWDFDTEDCLQNFLSLPLPISTLLVDLQSIIHFSEEGFQFFYNKGDWLDSKKKTTSLSVPVPPLFRHASFVEFLLDRQRSEEFHIDRDKFDEYLCQVALNKIRDYALALDSEKAKKSEDYAIYSFVTMLQTQASRRPFYLDQISIELSKWDALDETMLYDILRRLAVKNIRLGNRFPLRDIIDLNLWRHFAPAVERRRIQCHQALESAGLPRELFAIAELFNRFDLNLAGNNVYLKSNVSDLLALHIRSSIHHGADPDLWSRFLDDFKTDHRTPFGNRGLFIAFDGWYEFVEMAEVKLKLGISQWDKRSDLEKAVLFYFKHIVSLLDPSEDIHKSNEFIVAFDALKERLGEHWRALTAAYLLSYPASAVWQKCPISHDIAAALDDISNHFFPPHVVSSIEDAALPFNFPYPASKRDMLYSFMPACALPRWFKFPMDGYLIVFNQPIIPWISMLHDYKRIYDSRKGSGGVMNDDDFNTTSMDLDNDDERTTSAYSVARETMSETDYNNWSLYERVRNIIEDYKEAKREY